MLTFRVGKTKCLGEEDEEEVGEEKEEEELKNVTNLSPKKVSKVIDSGRGHWFDCELNEFFVFFFEH